MNIENLQLSFQDNSGLIEMPDQSNLENEAMLTAEFAREKHGIDDEKSYDHH